MLILTDGGGLNRLERSDFVLWGITDQRLGG
jgi:hypothetical protein